MSYHARFTEEETGIQRPHGLFCIPWLGCLDHSRGLAAFHLPAFAQPLPSKEPIPLCFLNCSGRVPGHLCLPCPSWPETSPELGHISRPAATLAHLNISGSIPGIVWEPEVSEQAGLAGKTDPERW